MVNRAINLVVLFIISATLLVFCFFVFRSWHNTSPLDYVWIQKVGSSPKYAADDLLYMINKAGDALDYASVDVLQEALNESYERSGNVRVGFSCSEIFEIFIYTIGSIFLLIFPVSANYVRSGFFRLWNRDS